MKCRVQITAPTDIPVWVPQELFNAWVEPGDLECRHSKTILDYYHPDWLHEKEGVRHFNPPAYSFFYTCNYPPTSPLHALQRIGSIHAINGRHRVVVLFRHMAVIPMLLVNPHEWPGEVLTEFLARKIEEKEFIELPDLPLNEAFPRG